MEKFNALAKVTILIYFSVHESFSACSNGHDVFVEGFLGRNVTLSCRPQASCNSIRWMNRTITKAFVSPTDTSHTSIYRTGRTSFLRIYGMTLDDAGRYSCWCQKDLGASGKAFCSVTLSAICQTTVRLHRVNILYNGSNIYPSSPQAVSVTVEDTIKVNCSEGATPVTNCRSVTEQDSSARFTYNFKVVPKHNLCYIACTEQGQVGNVCTVNITLHVSMRQSTTPSPTLSTTPSTTSPKFVEKTVHTSTLPGFTTILSFPSKTEGGISVTDKPSTFPVIVFAGILIFIPLAVTCVVCLWVLFSRSKSKSRSIKKINSVNSPSDDTIPIGPIYASVNKSSQEPKTGDCDSVPTDREAPSIEDFYSEVNCAGKEKSKTQQPNTASADSSITNDFYSAVNTSNTIIGSVKSANESGSPFYSEVNKREKQSQRKECTSSPQSSVCNPIVSQPYQVSEQPTLSDSNTVSDISNSQALYAVVEKDKRKK